MLALGLPLGVPVLFLPAWVVMAGRGRRGWLSGFEGKSSNLKTRKVCIDFTDFISLNKYF